jgi:hypothetical protein
MELEIIMLSELSRWRKTDTAGNLLICGVQSLKMKGRNVNQVLTGVRYQQGGEGERTGQVWSEYFITHVEIV